MKCCYNQELHLALPSVQGPNMSQEVQRNSRKAWCLKLCREEVWSWSVQIAALFLFGQKQKLCQERFSSPMASLVLTDSSQLTSDSQHLARWRTHNFHTGESSHRDSSRVQTSQESMMRQITDFVRPAESISLPTLSYLYLFCYHYSRPMASLVLTDSSQLTADGFEKLPDQIMISLRRTI
uniref:Uncharacterized protein n=1 Tax=Timema tahoe TaxID=61484 RepID=A0A7R9IN70_9NEOP|nr:unnamed protein product [Timema tahoe]